MLSLKTSAMLKDLIILHAHLGVVGFTALIVVTHCMIWLVPLVDHLTAGLDKNIMGVLKFTFRVLALPFRIFWFILCFPRTLANVYRFYRNVVFNWSLPIPPSTWRQDLNAALIVGAFASLPLWMHNTEHGLPAQLLKMNEWKEEDGRRMAGIRATLHSIKRGSMYVGAAWSLLGLYVLGIKILHFYMGRWQRWTWVKQNNPRHSMSRKELLETTAKEVADESIFA